VQAMVGPLGLKGEESFDILVCTPDWFAANMKDEIVFGRHYLFVKNYNYQALDEFLQKYCASCEGVSWKDVAEKIGRIGMWEFEDYVPYIEPSSKH
jgi:Immunity protein 8